MLTGLTIAAVITSALTAGILLAFSSMVMRPLSTLPPSEGVRAMQAVNVAAVRWPAILVFGPSLLLTVVVGIGSLTRLSEPSARWALTAAVIHVFGTFLLTAVYHVPRNNALAALPPASAEAASYWQTYLVEWTRMNHVRTLLAAVAAAGFCLALVA